MKDQIFVSRTESKMPNLRRIAYRYGTLLLSLMRRLPTGRRAATHREAPRVNQIYMWLPRKGGKIDKRAGRAASPAARLAPLQGWVGGKAWLSTGCTIENVSKPA
jgi:hypothetical protein